MTLPQDGDRDRNLQLRLWPGLVAVALQWLLWLVIPSFAPDWIAIGMVGGILGGGLAVLVWWLFFSRAPRIERWAALPLMLAAAAATRPILHPSVTGGMMGMMFGFFVVPTLSLALVVGAAVSRRFSDGPRRATIAA